MAKSNQVKRLYNIDDPAMFEESKNKHGFFVQDKADFIAFDVDFKDPFAANWNTAVTDAEALPTDETLDDQTTQLSAAVEKLMKSCRDKFQDSKYFIEKTFPDNLPVWNEFGYNNYDKARNIQRNMIQFMKTFHSIATKYKTDLIAKGYTQPMIDEIETLRAALDAANQAQELFIGNLPVQTQARITTYNDVWNIMVRVCTAGKRIYKNNFGKYQRYLLPPGEENPDALSITGTVADSVSNVPIKDATCDLEPVNLKTASATNGGFSFGGLPDGDYTLKVSAADYNGQSVPVTISGGNAVVVSVKLVHV